MKTGVNAWPGVIERSRPFLPVSATTPGVTLHEGNTLLLPAPRLAEATLTLTGHSLKDPDTALESTTRPISVPARLDAVLSQLGL